MKVYTVDEAAHLLNKARQTVRYLAGTHGIGTKHGRAWLFTGRIDQVGRGPEWGRRRAPARRREMRPWPPRS
jgi:hypothetical protein